MPQTVEVDEARGLILCRSWDTITTQDLEASRQHILRAHGDTGLQRVLVDAVAETRLPMVLELYDFGEELARTIGTAVRFAMVVSPQTAADREFLANVARNRGAVIRVFDDFDKAYDHLARAPAD